MLSINQRFTNFPKSRTNLKILGARMVKSNFHTEDPHVLNAPIQNVFATATLHEEFLHSSNKQVSIQRLLTN